MKKKIAAESDGLLPNYIVKKKICIVILKLYCKKLEKAGLEKLYCNTVYCIAKRG